MGGLEVLGGCGWATPGAWGSNQLLRQSLLNLLFEGSV